MTCYDSQVIQRLTAIQLDDCGRIAVSGANTVKGLHTTIQNVTRTRQVDVPQTTVTKTVNGGSCTKPRPAPTDRGYSYGLTFCGQNPVFEVITGYKTLDMDGDDIVGWEDVNLTGSPKVALEIIFTPTSDSCAGGETPQCIAVLVPMLEQWVRSGDEAYDGENVPDLQMTGQTALSENLFSNFTELTLPTYLEHWAPKFDDIATGRSWVYTRLIDCPTDVPAEDPCELIELDGVPS